MVDLRVKLPGSETEQPKFNYSSPVEAPGALKVATKKSGTASLLEGLATTGDALIKAGDQLFKNLVDDEAEAAVDQVREEFAVNGDIYGGRDITNDPQGTPEIERQLKYAREIHQGYMAGTIKDSNYWARLDSISRQLRTRYPGYRNYIDDKLSSMVGGTPANRLREELASEARAAAQSSEQDPRTKMYWSILQDAIKDGTAYRVNPNFEKQLSDGTLDMGAMVTGVAAANSLTWDIRTKQAQAGLMKDEAGLNKDNIKKLAQQDVQMNVNQTVLSAANQLGGGYKAMFNELRKRQAEGRMPKGQELNDYLGKLAVMKNDVKGLAYGILTNSWNGQPDAAYAHSLSKEEQEKIVEDALVPITILEEFITGKSTGMLERAETIMKYTQDGDAWGFMQANDSARTALAVRKLYGEQGAALLYAHNEQYLTETSRLLTDNMISQIVTGDSDSFVRTIRSSRDKFEAGNEEVAQSFQYVKDRLIKFLRSDDPNPEGFRTVANAMFNDKENLLSMLSTEQAGLLLGELTHPEITKRIKEMSVYDPEILKNYEKWATNGFMYINRSAFQTIKDVKVNRKYWDVFYRPDIQNFDTKPRTDQTTLADYNPLDPLAQIQSVSERAFSQTGHTAINDINRAINNFKPYAKEMGLNMDVFIERALQENGVDMNAPYEGPSMPTTFELGKMLGNAFRRMSKRAQDLELDEETKKILDGDKDQDRLVPKQ